MKAPTKPRPHLYAYGSQVTLHLRPEEGIFTIGTKAGHNIFNGEPCYQLIAADGCTLECVTESLINKTP